MNYLTQRNLFLKSCGNPTGEERERVIAAFDQTFVAQAARVQDAWAQLFDSLRWWK